MAKGMNYSRPKDTKKAIKQLMGYLGHHKWYMVAIAILVSISALASITGTYLLKPVINNYIIPGDIPGLLRMMVLMGIMYLCGASSCWAYNQLMVHLSQQVVREIRQDLFSKTQKLPLTYFAATNVIDRFYVIVSPTVSPSHVGRISSCQVITTERFQCVSGNVDTIIHACPTFIIAGSPLSTRFSVKIDIQIKILIAE